MELIDKAAVVAEIERLVNNYDKALDYEAALEDVRNFINSLEVKEVDLEKEIKEEYLKRRCYNDRDNMLVILNEQQFSEIAKHFFELGMRFNNPITAADRGMAEEIIINLKRVEQDYCINLTKEMEWLRNQVKKGE